MNERTSRVVWLTASVMLGAAFSVQAAESEPNPFLKPDESWISISGTVDTVAPDSFVLDYGDGLVTVEMDDGDRDADAYQLLRGDKVMVNGRIDDDFYETTKIEASSVYVEKLGTYFYASSLDEEDLLLPYVSSPLVLSSTVVQGIVSEVAGDEFTLDTGTRELTVSVESLPYNPLDADGYQIVRKGDLVRVAGSVDKDFFEGRELEARSLVKVFR